MKKVALLVVSLLLSFNAFAMNSDLGSAVAESIKNQRDSSKSGLSSIVYGGKDISRSIVASADESGWTRHPAAIG